jgi:DNA-binding MarR family transcriptional regulator
MPALNEILSGGMAGKMKKAKSNPELAITPQQRDKMLQVLGEFRVLFKSVRRHYAEVQRRSGITGAQLWALSHIADNPGIRAGELALALAIHPSTASNVIRDLERLKLLSKQRTKADQRAVHLAATQRGARILNRAPRPLIGVLQQALLETPAPKLELLLRELRKLVDSMHEKDLRARQQPLSSM